MNLALSKKEIADYVAANFDLPKGQAQDVVDAIFKRIAEDLEGGREVAIHGFGKFVTVKREAREGRNPVTGAAMTIPAKYVVQFKAAKALKDQVK